MKRLLIHMTVSALLVGGLFVPAAPAEGSKRHSPEHNAAVKKCNEAYEAAVTAAHAPNGPKGNERKHAMHAAAEAKKACIAKAPK